MTVSPPAMNSDSLVHTGTLLSGIGIDHSYFSLFFNRGEVTNRDLNIYLVSMLEMPGD